MVDVWTAADIELARRAADELAAGRPCVLATLVEGDALGGKLLLGTGRGDRWIMGDVEAGLATAIRDGLDEALGLRDHAVLHLPEHNATVFCESLRGQAELIIVGAGHVAQALCQVASFAGFAVTVLDNRERFANQERFPSAAQVLAEEIETTLPRLAIGQQTYIVIVTRGHQFDEGALRLVADSPAAYIGMIGSRRKVLLVYKRMFADGYDVAKLRRIYAPVGLEIGAETVEEIAISIVAELIKVRRLGGEGEVRHMSKTVALNTNPRPYG